MFVLGNTQVINDTCKRVFQAQPFAAKGAGLALAILLGSAPSFALNLGGVSVGASVGGGGVSVGVGVGGSGGVNAGVGIGGGGSSGGGINAGVGVGGSGGINAGVGIGGSGSGGIDVDVSVGGGGSGGGSGGGGGTGGGGTGGGGTGGGGTGGGGTGVVDNDTDGTGARTTSAARVAAAGKMPCAGGGNTTAFNGFVVRDPSGSTIGWVNDTTIGPDQAIRGVKIQSTGKACYTLSGGSFRLSGEEVWVNADKSAFR